MTISNYHPRIRRKRPSLRLIVSSATLDASYFLEYFTSNNAADEATIISLEGRMYPVDVAYSENPVPDYVRTAAETAYNINLQVSCFLHQVYRPLTLPANTRRYSYFPHGS